jgi:hypothetical protein
MQTFNLKWSGWNEADELPNRAGIYCVWSGPVKKRVDGTPTILHENARLLYIGQAGGISGRVSDHNKWPRWRRERMQSSDAIVFTYVLLPTAETDAAWRKSVENCLIATHRPRCNDEDLQYHYKLSVRIKNTGATFGKLKADHKCKGSDDPQDR